MNSLPIGDYALLSDCRSAALVSRAGSVDWLCFPRFDAPAVFARMLDSDGGHFAIRPVGDFQASRAYVDQTMALETTFRTATGTAVLTDAMAVGRNDRGHGLGAGSPGVLLRRLACTDGELEVEVTYAPRPEYGLIHPILEVVPGGVAARGGADRLLLSASADFRVDGATATARLHVVAGRRLVSRFTMGGCGSRRWPPGMPARSPPAWRTPWRDGAPGRPSTRPTRAPGGTWSTTPAGCCRRSPSSRPAPLSPRRPPRCRRPSAASATGTTGTRGSATPSLTMEALWVAACPDEANKFFGFLADASASQLQRGMDLQIMFGIGGERDLSERELPHLAGWRDSRPVRVGNGAWSQRQLDVYGELLGAAERLVQQLGELDPVTQQFLAAAADTAASRWNEKDQGIWEIRGEPRDFLYSKLMCWAALNRAITLAPQLAARHIGLRNGPGPAMRSARPSLSMAGARRRAPSPRPSAARTWTPPT